MSPCKHSLLYGHEYALEVSKKNLWVDTFQCCILASWMLRLTIPL